MKPRQEEEEEEDEERGMNLSEEWKSMWPISSVFSAPLLLSTGGDGGAESPSKSKAKVGPLIFNSSPETLTLLFSSPSLSPLLPPPFPNLSLPRFLSTTPSPNDPFSLLPSTSSSVAASLGPQLCDPSSLFRHNRLQLLRCPGTNSVLVFFPTGDNSDQVGFVLLSVDSFKLNVKRDDLGGVFTSKNRLSHRILRLLVNPVAHSCSGSDYMFDCGGRSGCLNKLAAYHFVRSMQNRAVHAVARKCSFGEELGCCWQINQSAIHGSVVFLSLNRTKLPRPRLVR